MGYPMPNKALTPNRPEYYVQTGSMFENPYGVPHDEIVAMLLELPNEVAAQVIFGKYVESSGLVFTGETIQMMFDRNLERVTADRWKQPEAILHAEQLRVAARERRLDSRILERNFATGVDFARQTDFTVIFTLDVSTRPARVVYYRRLNRVPWESIYLEVGRVAHAFGQNILADSTGMAGDVIFDALEGRRYCPVHDRTVLIDPHGGGGVCRDRDGNPLSPPCSSTHIPLACVEGYDFTTNSKKQLIEHLRNAAQVGYRRGSDEPFGWLRVPPIVQLEEELSFYAWDDKGLDTDTVMSLALAAWQGLEDVPASPYLGSLHGS